MLKAVLFDLDDTLFDHKHSRLCGLEALQEEHQKLQAVSLEQLEREHEVFLQENYGRVLDGKISSNEGVIERIRKLFSIHGVILTDEAAKDAANHYDLEYMKHRQAVPGAKALLEYLNKRSKVGVITNGLVTAQREKIRVCQIDQSIDFIVVSEEVGFKKPSREIFKVALQRGRAKPSEAVYVGDSWASDIMPARNCGIKTIWLNRYGLKCPDSNITSEIHAYVESDFQNLFS